MPGPVHCTDTLLVSVVSRAEQGRDTQTVTGRERERGRDFALAGSARRVVHLGVGVCMCVFGRSQRLESVCVSWGTVCHGLCSPKAKVA